VRTAFSRYISFKYSGGSGSIAVWLLDSTIEDRIRAAIRKTSGGHYLTFDPEVSEAIVNTIRNSIETQTGTSRGAVILTDLEIRRFVRKLLDADLPQVAVLSYQELPAELQISLEGRITLPDPEITHTDYEETPINPDPPLLRSTN
jgi:type III secretion protein V